MRLALSIPIQSLAVAAVLWVAAPHCAAKEGPEPATVPPIDPAPCFAAAEAHDDDKIIASCGPLIDGEKPPKPTASRC
jgi:hypothetical protein